ncbi:MAG: CRISPR-associated helicase Cas3' [Candidatus Parvarchaeota archaeon]|nr:CRISPR-associated helicase Cas3' [Candidatus Rehaiarchaeum fermentans]
MCIYSHPDVCMYNHINNLLGIAKQTKNDIPLHLRIAIVLHDAGKATKEFQDYLLNGGEQTKHSLLSASYTLYVCKERCKLEDEDCFWAFFYVANHHSDLTKLLGYLPNFHLKFEDIKQELKKVKNIDVKEFNNFIDNLHIEETLKEKLYLNSDNNFVGWIENKSKEFFKGIEKNIKRKAQTGYDLPEDLLFSDFWKRLYEFSILLDADKSSAALGDIIEERPISLTLCKIEKYTKNQQSPLKQLRDDAYKQAISYEEEGRIFTLTLPTGIGKTLTGLAFAIKHKPKRIIYALPFLSIIEQVQSVLEKLGLQFGKDFVTHHHLTEYNVDDLEKNNVDNNILRVFVEGWKAPIILTTFDKMFKTIFSNKNLNIRRLSNLTDSFVILDEVQVLPVKYWELIDKAITTLTEQLNCKVLYMTATQPYFTIKANEIVQKETFRTAINEYNRYELENRSDIKSFDKLIDFFKGIYEQDKRYLIVLNTIESSKKIYERLKKEFSDLTYLSTMLVPIHRKQRIEEIAQNKYKIVVSTQLIEAGVDIDFDVIIRDFAPLDSIVQTAGRVNRHSQKQNKGKIFVIRLEDEEHANKLYANKIYDSILLNITDNILNEQTLTESQLLNKIDEYFIQVNERKKQEEYIIEAIKEYDFKKIEKFTLIDDEPYKDSIFIKLDDKSEEIWEQAKDIVKRLKDKKINIFDAKREFEKIKGKFYSYVINAKPEGTQEDELLKIYFAGSELYNEEVGFTGKLNDQIW